MNELDVEKANKNKTVGRISRLFQKKPKKKSISSSTSTMSLSDPALQKPYPSSIASSQLSIPAEAPNRTTSLESRSIQTASDEGRHGNEITMVTTTNLILRSLVTVQKTPSRNMSISSKHSVNIQQLVSQQRLLLQDLDAQKAMVSSDVAHLEELLSKAQEKIKSRTHDMDVLKSNYDLHLRSLRSSDDDTESIRLKLVQLRQSIRALASELVPHAEPNVTSDKLGTLWLNLGPSIQRLGKPLSPQRIQMLTEKFIMDVLVQNLSTNVFPGLACNTEYLQLVEWFDRYDSSTFFSNRLGQELNMLILQNYKTSGSDIEQIWNKYVDRNWSHLHRGLQKAYPSYLKRASSSSSTTTATATAIENNTTEYGRKLRLLVEETINLGSIIKEQQVCITASDVKEGVQEFDSSLMEDEDGQTSGTIAFCISPPFIVKISNRYELIMKGRVLCFPPTSTTTPSTSTTIPTTTTNNNT